MSVSALGTGEAQCRQGECDGGERRSTARMNKEGRVDKNRKLRASSRAGARTALWIGVMTVAACSSSEESNSNAGPVGICGTDATTTVESQDKCLSDYYGRGAGLD